MGSSNSKSKKLNHQKELDKFFAREKKKELKREEKKIRNANPDRKRVGLKEPPLLLTGPLLLPSSAPGPAPSPSPAHIRSYDEEALDRMRNQLHNDSDAFLLNNILLSVQFFENFEREVHNIKSNPISEREHLINEAMVQRHKNVFFADRLQECIHEHVVYRRQRDQAEPLVAPRLFVIYDNVEASEPGDTSDYSAVLDAPFYKLEIEDCKEPGYARLKKLEVLESTVIKETDVVKAVLVSDDSVYTDSERESNDSDDLEHASKGVQLLQKLETKLIKTRNMNGSLNTDNINMNGNIDLSGRRGSGPTKQVSSQVQRSNIKNLNNFKKNTTIVPEETDMKEYKNGLYNFNPLDNREMKPRKSILKPPKKQSELNKDLKSKQYNNIHKRSTENIIAEDTETSGYRSTNSSRQNESSENESDYGYSTITESTKPKKVELSVPLNNSIQPSGVLPDKCWSAIHTRAISNWSDDEDDELDDSLSKSSLPQNLYETHQYLNSSSFMNNFVDNFIINLGSDLGLSQDAINSALTQGASIYCDSARNGSKIGCEVFPALKTSWPNAANEWIIRERRIIQNPRTNFSYQWPTKYMVNKAIGFGCLLVPVGFRPKRGMNPDQTLQWRVVFPSAERYLESCLAHSHMRCYLFALTLQKTFMEVETSKIGIDASHIKNHLFWQCEDNYARWPEDRLGESLRLFLNTFYVHFGQARFPNYFVDSCNDFKSIPKPVLYKLQRRLADILESPVPHLLNALSKLKYTKKDFYPKMNCYKLYDILTCKNPLQILNPAIPQMVTNNESSDSDDNDNQTNFWDSAKIHDKHYMWQKKRHRQMQERRKAQVNNIKKQKAASKEAGQINTKIMLPAKMETCRRRVVLEFFIPHFIAMARSSEKFEATRQAVIYLEQARRLCVLLDEESNGDSTANEYMNVIRDILADCQRKLVNQGGFKLSRRDTQVERPVRSINKQQRHIKKTTSNGQVSLTSPASPIDIQGISAFTFVDVHTENANQHSDMSDEESKL